MSPDCRTFTVQSANPARFLGHLLGNEIDITIKKRRRNKSTQQLGYWWGVLVPHSQAIWQENEGIVLHRDEVHQRIMYEIVGAKLVPKKIGNFQCYVIDRPHLSDASVEQVSEYIDTVVKYWAEAEYPVLEMGETGTLSDY
jgi:hypothetical protein